MVRQTVRQPLPLVRLCPTWLEASFTALKSAQQDRKPALPGTVLGKVGVAVKPYRITG